MLNSLGLSFLGLVMLIIGGEFVVKFSTKLAKSFGISSLIIGLTVVAFGTSAPELSVSIIAGLSGNQEIAITNVVGSNIFNTVFILGICSLIIPLVVNLQILKFDVPILIIISLAVWLLSLDGKISQFEGIGLVLTGIGYTYWLIRSGKKLSQEDRIEVKSRNDVSIQFVLFLILKIIIGLIILVYGSNLLIKGASDIAGYFGVSQTIIGLTIVAGGTSLPELVSSLMASLKGNKDMAVGNVIGSNIFNLLFILGTSSLVTSNGLVVKGNTLKYDIPIMALLSILGFYFLFTNRKLVRLEGAVFLSGYALYIYFLFVR